MSNRHIFAEALSRRRLLVATIAASLVTLSPQEAPAESGAEKLFVGTYKHAGGDKEREARDEAIEDVIATMNILSRTVAREKLKSANVIPAAISIASDGTNLTISLDSRVYTAPLDGSKVKVTGITGDKLDLSYSVTASKIEQRFTAEGKGRTNAFTKSGETLVVNVRVHSTQLPKDLKYKLTYKKG